MEERREHAELLPPPAWTGRLITAADDALSKPARGRSA